MPMLERYLHVASSVTSFFQKMTSLMMSFPEMMSFSGNDIILDIMGRAGDQQKNDAQAWPQESQHSSKGLSQARFWGHKGLMTNPNPNKNLELAFWHSSRFVTHSRRGRTREKRRDAGGDREGHHLWSRPAIDRMSRPRARSNTRRQIRSADLQIDRSSQKSRAASRPPPREATSRR